MERGMIAELKNRIRDIPDFPKKGILFKDITTLLSDAKSFRQAIDILSHRYIAHKTAYELEYGTNEIEIHKDAIKPGQKILIADDLLATGGTVHAATRLVKELKGEIEELAFLVELSFLKGR